MIRLPSDQKLNSRDVGFSAEENVAEFLLKKGLQLLEKNFQTPMGEVDLIMKEQDTVVFVEVKFRSGRGSIAAIDKMTPQKQKRVAKAALAYMNRRGWTDVSMRFDVVAVDGETIDWIPDAFTAPTIYMR